MIKKSCYVVVGQIQAGKTHFVDQIVKAVKEQSPCIGFIEKCLYKNNNRIGYDLLLNLNGTHFQFPFVRIKDRITPNDPNLFSFDKETIIQVKNLIKPKIEITKPPLLYFDEYGRIESKGLGLHSVMKSLIGQMSSNKIGFSAVFATRQQNLDKLLKDIKDDFKFDGKIQLLNLPANEKIKESFIDTVKQSLL